MNRPVSLLPCVLLAAGLAATGCSTQRTEEATSPSDSMSMEGIRTPDDPILGAMAEDGTCDPEVLTVENGTLIYHGQPGDEIEVSITPGAGEASGAAPENTPVDPRVETFAMGSTDTEHRLDLGEWSSLNASASGRVGLPGECTLSK
ncbi:MULTISPECIES: hypothetical protein [unclassified Corynebacterium]|uniref:hypothetical protein n=1 Tax=unclassified Corynebacterium TaxID=2624378 RepID=UPI0029CAA728|nr:MULTISPECIES: hypothetical protein [unclassified Corynebacterium]WPF65918.1 hypothetical protein OLX12_10245 [Corynebacterium sp. 22KM0430]WPF68411.1 hypothetical protein OLW90_10240 [Corynebacterium sp. 21KM1197]